MKWLIASDLHGSAYYCRELLTAYEKENADRLILLGDILYHGPRNDLPKEYDPKQVAEMLNGISDEILCIRGNCDAEVDQMVLKFQVMADVAFIDNGTQLIYLTHGHKWNIDNPLPAAKGSIIIYGHTHTQLCEERDGLIFLNPGSVSIPKNGGYHGYMTLENGIFMWKDFNDFTYKIR